MRIDWYKTSPAALNAMLGVQKIVNQSKIEHKLMELIKIRSSQINGCAYCLDMHTKDAIAIGENPQRLNVLAAWREAPFYSPRERAALAWCEALTNVSAAGAPDSVYGEVEKLFSHDEIVELTLAIVAINGWNRLAVAFRSDVGGYVSNLSVE
jgi:alkylhydroperoxidase AhpD family core domain